MAPGTTKPIPRRGRSKNLTLDFEAVAVLSALAAGHRTQGQFISQLILAEAARREERARLKAVLLAALVPEDADPTQRPMLSQGVLEELHRVGLE